MATAGAAGRAALCPAAGGQRLCGCAAPLVAPLVGPMSSLAPPYVPQRRLPLVAGGVRGATPRMPQRSLPCVSRPALPRSQRALPGPVPASGHVTWRHWSHPCGSPHCRACNESVTQHACIEAGGAVRGQVSVSLSSRRCGCLCSNRPPAPPVNSGRGRQPCAAGKRSGTRQAASGAACARAGRATRHSTRTGLGWSGGRLSAAHGGGRLWGCLQWCL